MYTVYTCRVACVLYVLCSAALMLYLLPMYNIKHPCIPRSQPCAPLLTHKNTPKLSLFSFCFGASQVARWYQGWKALFPLQLVTDTGIAAQFKAALAAMDSVLR